LQRAVFQVREALTAFYAFGQIQAVRKQPNEKRGYRDSEDNYEVHEAILGSALVAGDTPT
jgi:hypothetical protein